MIKAPWVGRPSERVSTCLVTLAWSHGVSAGKRGMCEAPASCCVPSSGLGPRAVRALPLRALRPPAPGPQQGGNPSVSRMDETTADDSAAPPRGPARALLGTVRSTEAACGGEQGNSCPWQNVACGGPEATSFTLQKGPEGR